MKCWKCGENLDTIIANETWYAEVDSVERNGEGIDWDSADFEPQEGAKIRYFCPHCGAFLTEDESEAAQILKHKQSDKTVKKPDIDALIKELKWEYNLD
jgi:hypothetical protein